MDALYIAGLVAVWVLAWVVFLPEFRRNYGKRDGPAYLLLFFVSGPLFLTAHLLRRRGERATPRPGVKTTG